MQEELDVLLDLGMETIRHKLPGKLIFFKVWGSHSHNTNVPESDIDYLAVYECHPLQLLSLKPPADTIDGVNPDFQSHELSKFTNLLLKGNPGIVECLFTEYGYWKMPVWERLQKLRHLFINQVTLGSYLGYCNGQLKRLSNGSRLHTKGGKYNTKWAYHLLRLAYDAERISLGNPPQVYKNINTDEYKLLMDVRRSMFSVDQIERMFVDIESRIKNNKSLGILSKEPPIEELNKWLVQERYNCFQIESVSDYL